MKWLVGTVLVTIIGFAGVVAWGLRPPSVQPDDRWQRYLPIGLRDGNPSVPVAEATSTSPAPVADEWPWEYLLASDRTYGVVLEPGTDRVWSSGGALVSWEFSPDYVDAEPHVHTMTDGLPANAFGMPTIAPDGRVWVGSRGHGAAWLGDDGRWHAAPHADGPLDDILDMEVDGDGALWFGTGEGASRLLPDGSWEHFTAYPSGGRSATIAGVGLHLAFDGLGNRWFGTYYEGLSVLRPDGSWHTYVPGDGSGTPSKVFNVLKVDRADRLWAAWTDLDDPAYPLRFHIRDVDGNWSEFDLSQLPVDAEAVRNVFFDLQNQPLFATSQGLVRMSLDGTWRREELPESIDDTSIYDIVHHPDGSVWVATGHGIAYSHPTDQWRTNRSGGLPSTYVHDIAFAPDGSAWLATSGGLVNRAPDGTISVTTADDGLFRDAVGRLAVDEAGGVWVSSGIDIDAEDVGGVHYRHPDGSIDRYGVEDGLLSAQVVDIALDRGGTAFFANRGYFYAPLERRSGGLSIRHADGGWTAHPRGSGPPSGGDPRALVIDDDGNLWIGSDIITGAPDDSLARRSPDGRFESVEIPPSVDHRQVQMLGLGPEGEVWVGLSSRILRWNPSVGWVEPLDDPDLAFRAEAMAVGPDGTVWVAADIAGVRYRTPEGAWHHIRETDGLSLDAARAVAVAPDGRIWFAGSDGGVSIYDPPAR